MPYVQRNQQGYVVGRYAAPQAGYAEEWLDDGHADLFSKTPEEQAYDAQKATDSAAVADAKLDPVIQFLVSHTPAECAQAIRGYIDSASVTNLATAQACLGRIETRMAQFAKALSVIARDKLR